MIFSRTAIKDLLKGSAVQIQALQQAYALLPSTSCLRKAHCCKLLPELTLAEALSAIDILIRMPSAERGRLLQKIIRYFFVNAVEITTCPFLEGQNCLIYAHRFFGCRAYGLWSKEYYENLSALNRRTKKNLRQQWETLGVNLPQNVTDFQVPYCPDVKVTEDWEINDDLILMASDKIREISSAFSQWHQLFATRYFCDLSFLVASLAYNPAVAVQIKFEFAKEYLTTQSQAKLHEIVAEIPDFLSDLEKAR